MKKKLNLLILFIALTIFNNVNATAQQIKWERLSIGYTGCTISGSTIIAYGTACSITISNDDGRTWSRKSLGSFDESILKMKSFGDTFVAFTSKSRLLRSDNNGKNWIASNFVVNDSLRDIAINENGVYLCCKRVVYSVDNAFTVRDSILLLNNNEPMSVTINQGKVFVAGNQGTLGVYSTQNNKLIRAIDFKALQLCSTCQAPTNIVPNGDTVYALLGTSIISTVNLGITWKVITSEGKRFSISGKDILTFRPLSINGSNRPFFIECQQFTNNKFQTISDSVMERFTYFSVFNQWSMKGQDTVIGVGQYNSIVISTNKGVSWNAISNLDTYLNGVWISENIGVASGSIGGRLFVTSNGGATWQPQRYSPDLPPTLKVYNTMYLDSTGFGFAYANQIEGTTVLVTKDFWASYKVYHTNIKSSFAPSIYPTKVFKIASHFVMFNTIKQDPNVWLKQYVMDSTFSRIDSVTVSQNYDFIDIQLGGQDTLKAWMFVRGTSPKILYRFSTDMGFTWVTIKEAVSKISKFDNAKIFGDTIIFINNVTIVSGTKLISKTMMYSFVISQNEWLNDSTTINEYYAYYIFTLGGIFNVFGSRYDAGESYYLRNNNISQKSSWLKDSTFKQLGVFTLHGTFPNSAYASVSVSPSGYYIYKLWADTSNVTSVAETEEVKSILSSFAPYPNPSSKIVHAHVYWDQSKEFIVKDCMVYNSLGEVVEKSENITLNKLDTYHGEIMWDCSHVGAGAYYIQVRHGNAQMVLPVIVYPR